jgi:hypothetical protein
VKAKEGITLDQINLPFLHLSYPAPYSKKGIGRAYGEALPEKSLKNLLTFSRLFIFPLWDELLLLLLWDKLI